MIITDLYRLARTIDGYCYALFSKIDDELVPQCHLVAVDKVAAVDQPHIYHSEHFAYKDKTYLFTLHFDSKVLDAYYKIPQSANLTHRSLLETIIFETMSYINECVQGLLYGEDVFEKSHSDLVKLSGRHFLQAILNNETLVNPFEKINKISSLSYEKAFSDGKILLMNHHDHYPLKTLVQFEEKIPLSSTRHIRKILELSNAEVYLLSDGEFLYSTVEFNLPNETPFDFFTIEFSNYFSWQLNHNGNKLMQVTHEEVYIPKPKVSFFNFSMEVKKLFPELESKKILNLYRLTLEALKQVKGTIIVVSKNARSEARRLRNQGFLIEALPLSPSIIRSITCIDGAVLMDLDGFCHGIGVILDGIATEKGDPSRGARYNSAIRYVETIAKTPNYADCFAIVISEDGDVDIISRYLY